MQLWAPVLAALLGGVGAQALSLALGWRRRRRVDAATIVTHEIAGSAELRGELWRQVTSLRKRQDALERRLAASQTAHFELQKRHRILEAEHEVLKAEHAELQEKYEAVQRQLQALQTQPR